MVKRLCSLCSRQRRRRIASLLARASSHPTHHTLSPTAVPESDEKGNIGIGIRALDNGYHLPVHDKQRSFLLLFLPLARVRIVVVDDRVCARVKDLFDCRVIARDGTQVCRITQRAHFSR